MRVITCLIIVLVGLQSKVVFSQLSPGTVVWSEDFDGGLPSDWTVINNNFNNVNWIWETQFRYGMFSNFLNRINSSTAKNGFMLLPMDHYNTPLSLPVSCDTYLAKSAITVPPNTNLVLRYQQQLRYCCSSQSRIEVQFSSDSISWQNFDVKNNLQINEIGQNGKEINVPIPISLTTGGKLYIRFYAANFSHYYWAIDDIEIVTPHTSAVSVEGIEFQNGSSFNTYTPYVSIPYLLADSFDLKLDLYNRGTVTQTSMSIHSNMYLDSSLNGQPVNSLVYSDSSSTPTLAVGTSSNVNLKNSFIPLATGYYRNKVEIKSSPRNQLSNRKERVIEFVVSDSVLSKRRVEVTYGGNTGLNDGFRLGTVYNIGSRGGKLTSISAFVSSIYLNDGARVRAELWSFDETILDPNQRMGVLLDSSLAYTIDSSDLASWINLPLLGKKQLSLNSQYLAVIYQVSSSGNYINYSTPYYYRKNDFRGLMADSYYYNSDSLRWDTVNHSYFINMNFGDFSVGVQNEVITKLDVRVFPNPSSGVFSISNSENIKQIEVYSIDGRLVNNGNEFLSGVDLSNQPNGMYLLKIELNSGEVVSKKLIKN